jgi:hypothetical protein
LSSQLTRVHLGSIEVSHCGSYFLYPPLLIAFYYSEIHSSPFLVSRMMPVSRTTEVDIFFRQVKKVKSGKILFVITYRIYSFSLQALQRDIESHSKIVSAVLKLCERLHSAKLDVSFENECKGLRIVAINLERRWHAIWLQSLEWQCRLEEAINKRKVRLSDIIHSIILFYCVSSCPFPSWAPRFNSHFTSRTTLQESSQICSCHSQKGGQSQPSKQDTPPWDKQTSSNGVEISNRFKHLHRGHYRHGQLLP